MRWNHGKRIIEAFFKRRAKRPTVCTRLESKAEADSDRSDIRMFEAGLSVEQYGDYKQGTGTAAREAESKRLIALAQEHGLYIPREQWPSFGDRKRLVSGESVVYLDNSGNSVIKIRDPFAKAAIKQLHAQDIIYEHLVHNLFFPDTRYQFVGISEDIDGVRIVLRQSYFSNQFVVPSQAEIDSYLKDVLGLVPEERYFYGNDYIAVTDLSSEGDNVLSDGEHLFFIDPIIRMKCPAVEILSYYCSMLS